MNIPGDLRNNFPNDSDDDDDDVVCVSIEDWYHFEYLVRMLELTVTH